MRKIFFFSALVLLAVSFHLFWQRYRPLPAAALAKAGQPVSISIPNLHLNLPLVVGHFAGGKWPLSSTSLVYIPEQSVIYGHNWPNLFGSLKKAAVGDIFILSYSDGSAKKFQIVSRSQVPANFTLPASDLTLYTCAGLFDRRRLVLTASSL